MSEFIDLKALSRPSSPNTYLIAPANFTVSAKADAESPLYSVSADRVFDALIDIISSEPRWKNVASDKAAGRIAFVAETPLLRFKDDVDIAVVDFSGQSSPVIYSRSRIGYSDMGANAKRVSKLLERLSDAVRVT